MTLSDGYGQENARRPAVMAEIQSKPAHPKTAPVMDVLSVPIMCLGWLRAAASGQAKGQPTILTFDDCIIHRNFAVIAVLGVR
jgi:hypothetical protein